MSGHNPHGRLGQPNPPWNHLQVPSFIPRQPQLAHMSNEPRPMNVVRSSPLAWHTPAHNEAALYNYMAAATHKTPLDINPLLPAFVRPPNNTPFGSVDLSLAGSSSRHNTTASPRTVASPANAMDIHMSNHSDHSSQQTCNGDNRGSSLLGTSPAGMFGNDPYHPLHDSLQLVKEAIHNSLRQQAAEQDLHELHELQAAISSKSRTPPINHNEPERSHSTGHPIQRSPVRNFISSPLPPPPLTPTHQHTSANFQRSPSSALHHSTSSCSSSASSSSSSSSTNNDLNQSIDSLPPDDKSQTRRRSRKPSKTMRMSIHNEDGVAGANNNIIPTDVVAGSPKVSSDTALPREYSRDNTDTSGAMNARENGSSQRSWQNDNCDPGPVPASGDTLIQSHPAVVDPCTPQDNPVIKPATPPNDLTTQLHPDRRKQETPQPEESETIDNIAAELAKTSHEREKTPVNDSPPSFTTLTTPTNAGSFVLTPVTISLVPVSLTANHLINTSSSPKIPPPSLNGIPAAMSDDPPKINGLADAIRPTTPVPTVPNEAIFEDVENKLEEMFAGIDDDRSSFGSNQAPDVITPKPSNKNASKKTSTPKAIVDETPAVKKKRKPVAKKVTKAAAAKSKKANAKKTKAVASTSAANASTSSAPDKKGSKQKEAPTADAMLPLVSRGPIVHVDHSGSSQVINGPVTEEVAEVKAKMKKGFIVGHHHPAGHAGDRSKIRGLHLSTLSNKYDAETTDTTWMCVFCKLGPHRYGLGDLFGPYIVSTACEEFQASQSDPTGTAFRSHHKQPGETVQRRSLPQTVVATNGGAKQRRKTNDPTPAVASISQTGAVSSPNAAAHSPSNSAITNPQPFHGMARASDNSYEVWMHGDCAVWSPGVHIIGTRIVGLEAAVWTSSGHRCALCHHYGAMLACLKRGCADEAHVPCARLATWSLCDDEFKSRCATHSVKVEPPSHVEASATASNPS